MTETPWPGPRPFRADEWRQFAGRDRDLAALLGWIDHGALVVELTGESGIGKTSFLRAGLVPTLTGETRGTKGDYRVVLCREWPREATTGEELYCRALNRAELPDGGVPFPSVEGGPLRFDEATVRSMVASVGPSEQVVMVFDQVEEMFRRNRVLAERFLETVGSVATTSHVAHILSLRDEYKHELRTIEMLLHPRDQEWMKLTPVLDVEQVIRQPADRMGFPIEPQAVAQVATWWKAASSKQEAGAQTAGSEEEEAAVQALGASRVGLLHLQALLWSVSEYWKQWGSPDRGITASLMRDFRIWARDRSTAWSGDGEAATQQDESALVADAVLRWIQERVSTCGASDEGTGRRQAEALFAAARAAPHLSSRGYKLSRPAVDLAWLALKQEFDTLQASRRSVGRAVRRFNGDEDSASTPDFPELASVTDERVAGRIRTSNHPSAAHAAAALVEAFVEGVQLLVDAEVVRPSSVFGGDRFYELVHDGYGPPLTYWSELELRKPRYDAQSLVVKRGLDLVHDRLTPDLSSLESPTLEGIGWWSCIIRPRTTATTVIRDLVFQDGDLRGSLFSNCSLSNVRFNGTNLVGVVFEECDFDEVVIDGGQVSGIVVKASELRGGGLVVRNIKDGSSDLTFIDVRGTELKLEQSRLPHVTFKPAVEGLEHLVIENTVLSRSLLRTSGLTRMTLTDATLRFVEIEAPSDGTTTVTAAPAHLISCRSDIPLAGTFENDEWSCDVTPKYGPSSG